MDYGWDYGHEDSKTVHPSLLTMYQRRQQHKWGSQSVGSTAIKARRPQQMPYHPNPHQTRAREIEGGEDEETRATIRRDQTGDVRDKGQEAGDGRGEEGEERKVIQEVGETYTIRRKKPCMDGSTCRHESDASHHRWQ